MKYYRIQQNNWTKEAGYERSILLPFGQKPLPDVQVQLTKIQPEEKVDYHYHIKQSEIIYCLEGEVDFLFKEKTVSIKHGDLIIIEPGEEHGAINIHDKTVCFITIKLNGTPNDTIWKD
jgi:quercetin dioxygenase-like cupin family protein